MHSKRWESHVGNRVWASQKWPSRLVDFFYSKTQRSLWVWLTLRDSKYLQNLRNSRAFYDQCTHNTCQARHFGSSHSSQSLDRSRALAYGYGHGSKWIGRIPPQKMKVSIPNLDWDDLEVSINMGIPIAGWFIMENPSINGCKLGVPLWQNGNLHLNMTMFGPGNSHFDISRLQLLIRGDAKIRRHRWYHDPRVCLKKGVGTHFYGCCSCRMS